ncbi:DUF2182 domain-containing protein [Longimicrobium sp.]|uniref:copper chaperone n=1 Tax=Longimicrobium sp. TaxID=2029185 RepID=UPI003B3A737C
MMMEPGPAELHLSPSVTAATHSPGTRPAGALRWLRGASTRPEWWMMMLISAAAWVFLATTGSDHAGTPSWPRHVAGLGAMVVAMMLPLTAGSVTELARSGFAPRRVFAGYIAGYLAVWMLAMFAIDAAWKMTASVAGRTTAVSVAIAAAVLWELAPPTWRRLHGAGQDAVPHASLGGRKDAGPVRSGVAAGGGCVKSCWAVMAACVAFSHSLPVMAAFFVIQLHGTYRRPAYPALAALAILAVCLASLALTMTGHHHHPHV